MSSLLSLLFEKSAVLYDIGPRRARASDGSWRDVGEEVLQLG